MQKNYGEIKLFNYAMLPFAPCKVIVLSTLPHFWYNLFFKVISLPTFAIAIDVYNPILIAFKIDNKLQWLKEQ